jgi:hypothetical protein
MFDFINKNSLAIYLLTITIGICVIFYGRLYNEIVIGSVKDEFKQYISDKPDEGKDYLASLRDEINKILDRNTINPDNEPKNYILVGCFSLFLFTALIDIYNNIKISPENTIGKFFSNKLVKTIFLFALIICFPLLIMIKDKIGLKINEDDKKVNDIFEHKNKENITKGIGLITGILCIYHLILSVISKGGLPVNLSMHNDFIFTEKMYLLFFIVLLCCSLIIAVKKKISITEDIIEKINGDYNTTNIIANKTTNTVNTNEEINNAQTKIDKFFKTDKDTYRINNNYLLNIFYSIFVLIICIYFYINHFKNAKYDLINGLRLNKLEWFNRLPYFLDFNIVILLIILIVIGFVPYSN